jgi:hypothetical protein
VIGVAGIWSVAEETVQYITNGFGDSGRIETNGLPIAQVVAQQYDPPYSTTPDKIDALAVQTSTSDTEAVFLLANSNQVDVAAQGYIICTVRVIGFSGPTYEWTLTMDFTLGPDGFPNIVLNEPAHFGTLGVGTDHSGTASFSIPLECDLTTEILYVEYTIDDFLHTTLSTLTNYIINSDHPLIVPPRNQFSTETESHFVLTTPGDFDFTMTNSGTQSLSSGINYTTGPDGDGGAWFEKIVIKGNGTPLTLH